jgi:hypothetical protein
LYQQGIKYITTQHNTMTFIQVLESEFYYLIEAIEHGSSDNEILENYKKELYNKTGYKYL